MNSRFLERLSALIGISTDPYDRACLNLEVASYLARRGDHADSSRIVQAVRNEGLHLLSPRVSAGLNFAEGMQLHCSGCDPEARVKWSRCIAIARSSRSNEVLARALAWVAFCDYTTLRIDSLVKCLSEAISVLDKGNYEGRARINMTLAQIYHLCGNFERALEFYNRSRLACLESSDDVMLAALIHNMAWLRMSAIRNERLREIFVRGENNIMELASESARNYESLIGSKAFDAMTPLLGAQVDIIQERYADAILIISDRLQDLSSQGLSRLSATLLADRAYCRAKLADYIGARSDVLAAIESISSEDHADDLAVLYERVSRVYKYIGETEISSQYNLKAESMWEIFDSFQRRMLLAIDCLDIA